MANPSVSIYTACIRPELYHKHYHPLFRPSNNNSQARWTIFTGDSSAALHQGFMQAQQWVCPTLHKGRDAARSTQCSALPLGRTLGSRVRSDHHRSLDRTDGPLRRRAGLPYTWLCPTMVATPSPSFSMCSVRFLDFNTDRLTPIIVSLFVVRIRTPRRY